jgi:hypothetical protein
MRRQQASGSMTACVERALAVGEVAIPPARLGMAQKL